MSVALYKRAGEIEAWAEAHMVDPRGVIYSFVNKETGQPLTDSFFEGFDAETVPGYTPAEFWGYENCGMTTGSYLQALVCRYEVEQDPAALTRARRCVQALKYVFDLGRQLEEGFFPKIYGNRFSAQTSTDQVLYTVLSLDRFYPFATDAEKKEIDHMIPAMVRFWVNREYRYTYFNFKDMQWPLARFPNLLLLAFNHSGDPLFKKEYERLLALGVNQHPGEEQLRPRLQGLCPPSDYDKSVHAWYVANLADCVTMDVMELDYLLRQDPQNTWAAAWKQSMLQMWNEAKITLAPDGKIFSGVLIDFETREVRRPVPILLANPSPLNLGGSSFSRYIHGAKSGWSTMAARAGVQACRHLSDNKEIRETVLHILSSIDLTDLTYYDEPERFLPEHRYNTRFISGDALANWLWAYWQGRVEKII